MGQCRTLDAAGNFGCCSLLSIIMVITVHVITRPFLFGTKIFRSHTRSSSPDNEEKLALLLWQTYVHIQIHIKDIQQSSTMPVQQLTSIKLTPSLDWIYPKNCESH